MLKIGLWTLKNSTFERGGYKELLELMIIWLGGQIHKFSFKVPGANHHARWMSKAIYYLKLALLQMHFSMDEKADVNKMAGFVGLYYGHIFI